MALTQLQFRVICGLSQKAHTTEIEIEDTNPVIIPELNKILRIILKDLRTRNNRRNTMKWGVAQLRPNLIFLWLNCRGRSSCANVKLVAEKS